MQMRSQRAKGVILCGMMGDECLEFYKKYIADGNMSYTPIVPIVNVESDLSSIGIDSVFINYREAARQATNHLIELGCRRILPAKAVCVSRGLTTTEMRFPKMASNMMKDSFAAER